MAAKTWGAGTGAGTDGLWSTGANWTGDTVPATTDAITFDGTCAFDCTIDNVGTFSGGTFHVDAGYLGHITQSVSMTTGAFDTAGIQPAGYTQNAALVTTTFLLNGSTYVAGEWVHNGTFQCTTFRITGGKWSGGTQSMLCTGAVTLEGGSSRITCTSGTWECRGSITSTFSLDSLLSGNGGTLLVGGSSSQTINTPSTFVTWNLVTITKTGSGLTISSGTVIPLGSSPTSVFGVGGLGMTVTGTVTVSGHWTFQGLDLIISATTGTVSGALTDLTFGDDLLINATATWPASVALHVINGGSTSVITATAHSFATSTILKTNGACTIAANTTFPLGANPTTTTTGFTLTATGTITVSGTWAHTGALTVSTTTGVVSGALTTFSLTSSFTVAATGTFPSGVAVTLGGTGAVVVDATTVTFGQFIFNRGVTTGSTTVTAGTTLPLGTDPIIVTGTGAFAWSGNMSATGTITYANGGAVTFGAASVVTGTFVWKSMIGDFTLNAATTWPATGGYEASFASSTARFLAGAGKTFASLRRSGAGSGTFTITGTNTFTLFRDDDGTVAHTIVFPNVTTTVGQFLVRGSSGKLVTLIRTGAAGTFTLAKSTAGNVDQVAFISVSNSTVDASPVWYAGLTPPSVDGGGNTNWIFTDPPNIQKFRKSSVLL